MRATATENERVGHPVYHFGLSLQPGEHLDRRRWEDAIDRVLRRMGLADHQTVLVAHRDSGHEHVHLVINRVGRTDFEDETVVADQDFANPRLAQLRDDATAEGELVEGAGVFANAPDESGGIAW